MTSLRSEQAQRDVTREVRGLLFTAVRVESHKGIAGSSWKSDNVHRIYGRNFQRNVNVGPYTSPPTRPVYSRHENARAHTNIFTINPAFYLGLVPELYLQSLSDLIRPNKRQILITSRIPSLPVYEKSHGSYISLLINFCLIICLLFVLEIRTCKILKINNLFVTLKILYVQLLIKFAINDKEWNCIWNTEQIRTSMISFKH